MQSINDLSCSNDQLATSAGCRALERKMIADLMAKVNFVPDKVTPIDAMKSHAQLAMEHYGIADRWANEYANSLAGRIEREYLEQQRKFASFGDIAKSIAIQAQSISLLALADFDADKFKHVKIRIVPAYRRIKQKSDLLLTLAEHLKSNYTLILSVLSNKTANYLRGISERIIDAMTFKNSLLVQLSSEYQKIPVR
jgi:hypothetical protein